jgi:GT2 family glycosyltransferase
VPTEVTALLVVHNGQTDASRAQAAIENQTLKPTRILVVENDSQRLGAVVKNALSELDKSAKHWLWLVHDDSEPKPTALAELIQASENSDTIAQVGPMQLSAKRPREISQLGLTLSRFAEIINPIKGQLDQGQHDRVTDVFAIGTSGMLVRTDAYEQVGGLNDRTATLAADIDLSMRFRRHGYRVVVAPRAKVLHESLTLAGKRGKAWLGGSIRTALRKASIQLRLTHDPLALAWLYWLLLPLVTFYRMFWRLAQKRPGYLWAELRAGVWGFVTFPKRLASRANSGKLPTKTLKPLRATWAEVSKHNRQALESEESAQSLASFERGDHEIVAAERPKNFVRSLAWLFVLALLALSLTQFPVSESVSGGAATPLTENWFTIFARAGASWQPIGQGFVAPSNPFNWVLLALGTVTFWSPNLALVVLIWSARALAFSSAWRALSLLTAKAWQRNLGALLYALLPAFTASIAAGEYPAIVATVLSPWLVFAVARAAGLGRSGSARSDARTWSWVGLAGILFAAVGAAAPELIVVTLLGLALVAFTKIRRLGYLFWIPLPLAAIYFPLALHEVIGLAHPLALFAEPTGAVSLSSTGNQVFVTYSLIVIGVLAILSLLTKRWVVGFAIFGFGILTYVLGLFVGSLQFPDGVTNTGHSLNAVIGLTAIALAIHFVAALKAKVTLAGVGILLLTASLPLGYAVVTANITAKPSDASVVPLLLQKQAEQGTDLQILEIDMAGKGYRVNWLPISGIHLEDSNLAYRFAGNDVNRSESYQAIAQVVGDLVSGNGAANLNVLKDNKIGYVMVPNSPENASVIAALESSELLEGAGLTPFGELWRVNGMSATDAPATEHSPWSVTKAIQLATLLGFMLLAIPSRPRMKQATDSVIFIDQSESELDV